MQFQLQYVIYIYIYICYLQNVPNYRSTDPFTFSLQLIILKKYILLQICKIKYFDQLNRKKCFIQFQLILSKK